MKKQINPTIKAHLIRGAFYLLLLLAVCAIPFALAQRNTKPRRRQSRFRNSLRNLTRARICPYAVRGVPNLPRMSQVPQNTSGVRAAHVLPMPRLPKAPQVVLYDQYNNNGPNATLSATFTDFPTSSADLADDFVVPGGQTWNVQSIDADGVYFNGPGPATNWNVFIYSDSSTLPGTQVYSTLNQPVTQVGTTFTVNLTPAAVLAAGTYWIEIQANMTFGTQGEWGWTDRTVQSNNGAAFRNPGGAFGCGTNWVRKPVCVPTTSGPDQVYRINGTIGGGGTPTPTATASPTPTATASCTPSYTFTSGTGTIVPGVTDTTNHCDDCTTVISLPFSVTLYDQTFTSATVGSNGIFAFGTNPNAFHGSCLPVTGATYATMPFYRDQRTDAIGGCTGCGIFTTTSGTAPNRVFRVEYRTIYFGETSTTPTLNYEVNVYENGIPAFDYTYGLVNSTTQTGRITSIGVQQNTTRFTQFACDTTGQNPPVTTGQKLTATLRHADHLRRLRRQLRRRPARLAAAASSVLGPRPRLARRFAIAPVDAVMGRTFTSTAEAMTLVVSATTSGAGTRQLGPGHNWPTCRLPSRTFKVPTGTAKYTFRAVSPALILPRTPSTTSPPMRGVPGAPLPAPQTGTNVAFNNKIYNFGGNPGPQATVTIYDIATNAWTTGASMPVPITYGRSTAAGNFAYYAGGIAGVTVPTVYRYDFAANTWATMAPLQTARTSEELMTSPDGCKLYAVMGGDATFFAGVPLAQTVEIYDIAANSWTYSTPVVATAAGPGGGLAGGKAMVQGGVDDTTYYNLAQVAPVNCQGGSPTPTATATATHTADSYANSHSNSYAYTDSYSYSYSHSNSYAYTDSYGNGHSNGDCDCECVTEAHADAQAATHATSTPISSSV